MRSLLDLKREHLRPMSEKGVQLLMTLALVKSKDADSDKPQKLTDGEPLLGLGPDSVNGQPFLLRVLLKRLIWAGEGEYSTCALLFAAGNSRNPGTAVMWAYALWRMSKRKPVTMDDLIMDEDAPFAWGVPTEEAYAELWEEQKCSGSPLGNLLDDPATWDLASERDVMAEACA